MKLRLSGKLLLYILTSSVIIYAVYFGYLIINQRNKALDDARAIADAIADKYATQIRGQLEADLSKVRTLSQSFLGYKNIPDYLRDSIYLEMQRQVLVANTEFIGVGTSWEINALDSSYTKDYGRRLSGYFRKSGEIKFFEKTQNLDGDDIKSDYYRLKTTGNDAVMNPEFYSYTDKIDDRVLSSNISVPIMDEGKFVGVAGVDISLARFQKIIDRVHPFERSFAMLLSNNGRIVAHPNEKYINETFAYIYPSQNKDFDIMKKIAEGKTFNYQADDATGTNYYISFATIQIEKINTPWSFAIAIPTSVIMSETNRDFAIAIVVGFISMIIMSVIIWFISRNIAEPLIQITSSLKDLSEGNIDARHKIQVQSDDEIGEIASSVNKLIDGLNSTATFASDIGKGNLNAEFKILSNRDILGNSLIEMRKNLQQAQNADKLRKIEEEKLNWASQGINQMSELLRISHDNLNEFAYTVISSLVKYVGVNQGGMFFLNDTDPDNVYLELMSSYAYDRRKMQQKRIELGVGVIGRAIKERETVYMTDLPEEYMDITSGLGFGSPRSLLVVPLFHNDEPFGVIELASFTPFEQHQIQFVEKVAQSIASTLSTIKISLRTSHLLAEANKEAQKLIAQETAVREQYEKTKLEYSKLHNQLKELQENYDAINTAVLAIEYDPLGNVVSANKAFLQTIEYNNEQIRNETIFSFVPKDKRVHFQRKLEDIKLGETYQTEMPHETKNGKTVWLIEQYKPIFDEKENLKKIMYFAYDITAERERENTMIQQENRLREQIKTLEKASETMHDLSLRQQERVFELEQKQSATDEELRLRIERHREQTTELKHAYEMLINDLFTNWQQTLEKIKQQNT